MTNFLQPANFEFDHAPLNQWYHGVGAVVIYLALINIIERRALRKGVSSQTVNMILRIQAVHNLALCLGSLFMVLMTLYLIAVYDVKWWPSYIDGRSSVTGRVIPSDPGSDYLLCPQLPGSHDGRFGFVVYLFYLSKYWELLDTVLQVSKGRRPPSYHFHIWHHTCYLMICWSYMKYRCSLSILAVVINGGVHVIMYYYYHLQVLGYHVSWKPWITRIQIIQFITGYVFFLTTAKKIYWDRLPCNGKITLFIHAGFNMTMLVGFVQILLRIMNEKKHHPLSVSGGRGIGAGGLSAHQTRVLTNGAMSKGGRGRLSGGKGAPDSVSLMEMRGQKGCSKGGLDVSSSRQHDDELLGLDMELDLELEEENSSDRSDLSDHIRNPMNELMKQTIKNRVNAAQSTKENFIHQSNALKDMGGDLKANNDAPKGF